MREARLYVCHETGGSRHVSAPAAQDRLALYWREENALTVPPQPDEPALQLALDQQRLKIIFLERIGQPIQPMPGQKHQFLLDVHLRLG